MRYLSKLQTLNSSSGFKLLHFRVFGFQILHVSKLSKLCKHSHLKKTQENHKKKGTETEGIGSLFSEITEILGADNLVIDRTSSGISIAVETHVGEKAVREDYPSGIQGVCGYAEDNVRQEKADPLVLEDVRLENLGGTDVGPVVHRITEIIQDENDAISMDTRLENSGFVFNSEIVEKVLKRCFKVPHLALRFFNSLKLRNGFRHTTATYNTMMYIAGEAREFGLVEELSEEMESNTCEKDIKTWTILISNYGKAKLIGKALLVFERMRKSGYEPDVVAYKLMIRSLCIAGKTEIAMEFYREMVQKDMGLNMNSYKMLLNCLAASGDIAAVHMVAGDMMKVSQIADHDVYNCMLKSFCISGRIKEALELIHDLMSKNITLNHENFETLVKGFCRADRIADALEIVDIMKKKNLLDGKVYGIIISEYLKKNDISKAFDLFHRIMESGHLPTVSTYTELMQHLFRSNEYQKGCKLYEDMVMRGIEPDNVAITALVAGHIHHNHIPEAWKMLRSMEEKGSRMTWKSYSVFIKELCKISMTDEIVKVLNEMRASKIVIGDKIFHWIISYLQKKGDTDNIEKIKKIERTCKVYPQENEPSVSDVSKGQDHNMDSKSYQTEPIRAEFNLVEPPLEAYSKQDLQEICRILSSSADWLSIEEALGRCTVQYTPPLVVEVLRSSTVHGHAALQFFSWLGKQDGYSHTTETYNMAIKIAGRGKDFKHMRYLFFEMRRRGLLAAANTWTIMIMQYGRTGLTEIAMMNFQEMKASGCKPSSSTYKYLIISLCGKKGRKVNEAIKIFKEMVHAGHIPDKELIEIYLECLCETGNLSDARRCTESLRKVGFTISLSYSLYIRALCRAGRLDEALSLLDEVELGSEQSTLNRYIYASIVHGLLQRGQLEEALARVDAMKQVGIHPPVHVYTSLIVYFFREKQVERALEMFNKMREEGHEPTLITYSALIRGYMSMGKATDAWDVFNRIKLEGPFPDFKTYSMFIACLCRIGKSEEALQILSEMLDSGIVPSTINFRTIFYGLNREGKQNLACTVLQKKLALRRNQKFLT
ncbi:putative pentatricopeptide repeat-containing protein At5g06400, mitochondrial [Malania oleifera]|uniref:putative pentatricopeptide repeat-containing protein At5g06400, mitochondrial n=1 Tax=Malania oleifera TaxID=397392 RepID=UPI0025AE9CC1|nr:putative pentatricopeptide repeat-containing protein At5g06400, mitochondrial [Malania oleifera]